MYTHTTRARDRAIYDPYQANATALRCPTAPTAITCIGKSFFDSYNSFPNTKYSHGFNLAWNNYSGYLTLEQTVPLACKAIGLANFEAWELGNEPDLYIGKWRPENWTVGEYLADWENGTAHIHSYLQQACPGFSDRGYQFMAPSLSSPGARIPPDDVAADGESTVKHPVNRFSVHNYITGATVPGVTLANSLLNHNSTVNSLNKHVAVAENISHDVGLEKTPYVIGMRFTLLLLDLTDDVTGECNSLYGGGRAGLSNVFGSALWVVDFTLYAASTGVIHRLHYHQSPTAPYAAWVPSGVNATTNPAYYGKLAAATFLGDSTHRTVTNLVLVPGGSETQVGYAGYRDGQLDRLAIINMMEYNSTETTPRPNMNYSFQVPLQSSWKAERLTAAGADVMSGVTFGGIAYDYSTLGRAKQMTYPGYEIISADKNGNIEVCVQDSEAVILSRLDC